MTRFASIALQIAILLGLASPAVADDPQITLQVSATDIYADDVLTLVIKVSRHDQPIGTIDPAFDASNDFEFSQGSVMQGSQTTARLDGNRAVRAVRFDTSIQYSLSPRRTGTLTIPAATIEIDGTQYRTNPVEIRVSTPPVADFATVSLLPTDTVAYVGQAIPMRLAWEINRDIEDGRMIGDDLPLGAEIFSAAPTAADVQSSTSLNFMGKSIPAAVTRSTGGVGLKVDAPFRVVFDTPGFHTLGPVGVVFTARQGNATRRFSAESQPVTVDVRPLPERNRPETFSGIVGPCEIQTSLSSSSMRVGDPVTLTVRLKGELPPSRLPAPAVHLQKSITEALRLAPGGWVDGGEQGEWRVYSMTVRPQIPALKEVPPIEVSYFDPASAEYRVAKSRPIPVTVEASRQVTAADAIGAGGRAIAPETLPSAEPGIRANQTGKDRLIQESFDLDARLRSPIVFGVLFGAPGLWTVVAGTAFIARRSSPARRRRARLLRSAGSLARSADPSRRALAARSFVAAHTNLDPEAVTMLDAERLLESTRTEDRVTILNALRDAEAVDFGRAPPPSPSGTNLRGAIRSLARRLEDQA